MNIIIGTAVSCKHHLRNIIFLQVATMLSKFISVTSVQTYSLDDYTDRFACVLNGAFQCLPTSYGYWKIEQPATYSVHDGFPIVVDLLKDGKSWFAIPALEYPNLIKVQCQRHPSASNSGPLAGRDPRGPQISARCSTDQAIFENII